MNCTVEEGEVLFIPSFWWHEVKSFPNVTEGRNLAINFWYVCLLLFVLYIQKIGIRGILVNKWRLDKKGSTYKIICVLK